MKRSAQLLAVLLAVFCFASTANAATYFTATFDSAQEVPTNSSTARGFGRVTLNDAQTQITVSMTFSGLSSNQTAAHIHGSAPRGVNAPILFNIGSSGATSGTFTNLTFAVTPAQVAQLKAGRWYYNVHSANFPGGEIRGQIELDSPFVAYLNSRQEVPENSSNATGRGAVSLNATGTQIVASLQFAGLSSNQIAAHIHGAARADVNAPILFNIGSTGATSGTFTDLFFNVTPAQVEQLKRGQHYFNVHSVNFPGGEIRGQILKRRSTALDFDGDSKTDFVVARENEAENSITWFVSQSSDSALRSFVFGNSGDFSSTRLLGGDFDGDGKDDLVVWRPGDLAYFYILNSSDGTVRTEQFGKTGDDPRVIYDFDGDGRVDPAVYRPGATAGEQSYFYYRPSASPSVDFVSLAWGIAGDFPYAGDFDGDGRGDICVQRAASGGVHYCLNSTDGFTIIYWGDANDFNAPGDYDGDGKTDIAVIRTVAGSRIWYPYYSSNPPGSGTLRAFSWGPTGAARTQGDYDGDGKTDIAVWIPGATSGAQSRYWVLRNDNSYFTFDWGVNGDISVNAFNIR